MIRFVVLLLVPLVVSACQGPSRETADAPNRAAEAETAASMPAASGGDTSSPPPSAGSPPATRDGGPGSSADEEGEAPLRVVFLGTSLTAGMGLEDRSRAFPARVESLADSAGIPVEVVNAGVEGDTSAGGLRRLEWVLAGGADVLVVELGANDGLRGLDTGALEGNLHRIIARAREIQPGIEIVLAGMEAPPNLGADYTRSFRRVFTRLARSHDVTLVPFLLDGVAGVPSLNQDDGIHPNRAGHRRIAEEILWPVLAPVLRSAAADGGDQTSGGAAGPGGATGGPA